LTRCRAILPDVERRIVDQGREVEMRQRVPQSRVLSAILLCALLSVAGCACNGSTTATKKPTAVKLNDDPNTKLGCDQFSDMDSLSLQNMQSVYNLLSTSKSSAIRLQATQLWVAVQAKAIHTIPSAQKDLADACRSWKSERGLLPNAPVVAAPSHPTSRGSSTAIASRINAAPIPVGSTEDMSYRFRDGDNASYKPPPGFGLADLRSFYDRQLPLKSDWRGWKWCGSDAGNAEMGNFLERIWIIPHTPKTLILTVGNNSADGRSDPFVSVERTDDTEPDSSCPG
jgi:hypothetical protein